ncbi:MAG: HU family DNA-binding protein [bacterium]
MTKADLILNVAKKTKTSQAMAANVIDTALAEIRTLLAKGGSISFTGFGAFSVAKRAKRKGRNPQTGKEMTIAAIKVARFRPGKGLRASVAGKKK